MVHHSDRGSQYTSGEGAGRRGRSPPWGRSGTGTTRALLRHGRVSLIDPRRFQGRDEARSALFFNEAVYNRRRRHSTLGDLSPAEYEGRHAAAGDETGERAQAA